MRKIWSKPWFRLFGLAALGAALMSPLLVLALGSVPTRSEAPASREPVWAAAAPGRVEPKRGVLRIVAQAPATIEAVAVSLNDHVQKGDILIRLDDEDQKARLEAAIAQVAVRTTERDNVKASESAKDRRKAEDSLYDAERAALDARLDLDRLILQAKDGNASAADVAKARAAIGAANEKVQQAQQKLNKVLARDLPALKREEAALAAARADVAVLSASLERTRIRAPIDGTVLELNAKAGEMASVTPDRPLLTLGDTSHLQVRAEVEDRDIASIQQGQAAIVKSEAFPGRAFEARVITVAKALGAPKLSPQNHRAPADADVLEVVLDLDDGSPLLPGMRVDVLFREPSADQKSSSASAAQ